MANLEFYNKKMKDFIDNCITKNIEETNLFVRFREEITQDNLTNRLNNT